MEYAIAMEGKASKVLTIMLAVLIGTAIGMVSGPSLILTILFAICGVAIVVTPIASGVDVFRLFTGSSCPIPPTHFGTALAVSVVATHLGEIVTLLMITGVFLLPVTCAAFGASMALKKVINRAKEVTEIEKDVLKKAGWTEQ